MSPRGGTVDFGGGVAGLEEGGGLRYVQTFVVLFSILRTIVVSDVHYTR